MALKKNLKPMKSLITLILFTSAFAANSQVANKNYNQDRNSKLLNSENEIVATENSISIITKVIYNAVPDGYHITYTTSFIGKSIEEVEALMNKKMDSLVKKVRSINLSRKDIV